MSRLLLTTTICLGFALARASAAGPDHASPPAGTEQVQAEGHAPAADPAHDAEHEEPNPIPPPAKGIILSVSTLLVFLGLVFILGRYAWGPIVAGLKAREDKIRADIGAAERARTQADEARRQFEQQLSTAEERVRQMLARAQSDGQQLATRIRTQAQQEAEEIKQKAIHEIEQSQREAVEEIRGYAATLATSVAEKILRREVSREDQRRLVEESLEEFQGVATGA